MLGRPDSITIDGPAGRIEVVVEDPAQAPRGLAVVAHPHPLMGGTMDNKVVHTLSRAFVLAGWRAVRFNFRGVGRTEGAYDEGRGEALDMLAVLAHHQADAAVQGLPVALAGFSFGGHVAALAHAHLAQGVAVKQGAAGADVAAAQTSSAAPSHDAPASHISQMVLVSPAASRFEVPPVPAHALVVQGEADDVVPLAAVLDWARPQNLPVTVVPGTGHFFHGQLGLLREIVLRHLRSGAAAGGD